MTQSILQDVELEPADGSHERFQVIEAPHDLHCPFLRHLLHSLVERLSLADIGRTDARKYLRLKLRQGFEAKAARHGNGVADGEDTWIDNADDVARECLFDRAALLRDETVRPGQTNVTTETMMLHDHVPLEPPGAHTEKSGAVPVLRVHVGLELEDVGAERLFDRINGLLSPVVCIRQPGTGSRRQLNEGIQKALDAEIRQRRGKEHRRDLSA